MRRSAVVYPKQLPPGGLTRAPNDSISPHFVKDFRFKDIDRYSQSEGLFTKKKILVHPPKKSEKSEKNT